MATWKKLFRLIENFDTTQPCPPKYRMVTHLVKTIQQIIKTTQTVEKTKQEAQQKMAQHQQRQMQQAIAGRQNMGNMMPNMGLPGMMGAMPGMGGFPGMNPEVMLQKIKNNMSGNNVVHMPPKQKAPPEEPPQEPIADSDSD